MRGQDSITIDDFRGLFDRGLKEHCPLNYFTACSNLEFSHKKFRTRGSFTTSITFTAVAGGEIIGYYLFPRLDGTVRRLLLIHFGGLSQVRLYDQDHAAPPFLVATYSDVTSALSVIPLFDRLYIAALGTTDAPHTHQPTAVIQVYDGTNVARNAAGVAPSGASMTATQPGAGNVSAGIHLYAVAFETPSGYITKAGPAVWTNFTSSGTKNINLAAIPVGPAGTVARHLLATKRIPTYGPPQENFELFFLPTGTIPDNVTTTLTFDFFDSELVNSADYLLNQYETIPAGPLFSIGSSLGVAGYKTDGTSAGDKTSIALISKGVEIEAFSINEGFIVVKPTLGGPLTNGLDLNGTLFLFKESLTAAIQPDYNLAPSEWGEPGLIDSVLGTSPFGIASYIGAPFIIAGGAFILTRQGLQHFTGRYSNLSFVIDDFWTIGSLADFKTSIATVDPIKKRVYIFLTKTAGLIFPDKFMVMDWKEGIVSDTVKWCEWTAENFASQGSNFRGMSTDKNGVVYVTGDFSASTIFKLNLPTGSDIPRFESYAETAKLRFSQLPYISNFQTLVLGAKGVGPIQIDCFSKDDVISDTTIPDVTLLSNIDKYLRRLLNFTSQMVSIRLTTLDNTVYVEGNWMEVSSIFVFGHVEAEEYPE